MKKAKILLIGAAMFCLPTLTNADSNDLPTPSSYTFYFTTSCGTYHEITLVRFGGAPIAEAHNIAMEFSAEECGPGSPVPKVWMMAP